MVKFKVVHLCKQKAMSIVPTEVVRYDLGRSAELLSQAGYAVDDRGLMVVASGEGRELTLYTSGRMLITGVSTKEEAGRIATAAYAAVEPAVEPPTRRS